ncbi:hypothetical protein [Pelagibacterium sp.]|uniref:hypothetical protein n=1 Tax=Pelagibacterium sp. TaxID=1967288 RepID=UPI003A91B274
MSNVTEFPGGKKRGNGKGGGGPGRPPTGNNGDRLVSMHALGQLLGVDRSAITRWVKTPDNPCPSVHDPKDGAGKGWVFDVKAVVEWRIETTRRAAVAAALSNTGVDGEMLDFDERYKRGRAVEKELNVGVLQDSLVFAVDVAKARDEEIGRFAQEIRAIPAKAARDINPKDQVRIQGLLDRYIDAALDRLADGGDDDDDE